MLQLQKQTGIEQESCGDAEYEKVGLRMYDMRINKSLGVSDEIF